MYHRNKNNNKKHFNHNTTGLVVVVVSVVVDLVEIVMVQSGVELKRSSAPADWPAISLYSDSEQKKSI